MIERVSERLDRSAEASPPAESGAGTPPGMVRLVAVREITTRLRERSFFISTAITILIIVGVIVVPRLLNRGGDTTTVGVTPAASEELRPALAQAARLQGTTLEIRPYADEAAARAAVERGDVDLAFVGTDRIVVKKSLDSTSGAVAQAAYRQVASAQRLAAAGIDPARAAAALTVPPLAVTATEGAGSGKAARRATAFFGIVLLYGQLIGYGLWVALGVVEEKSSRVVELLLATLRPWQLLAGKILGIGLLGLAQFVTIGVIGIATAVGIGAVSVPVDILGVVGQVLVWFVLGYGFYSCLFAAAAALVSRQEELQNITAPLTILLVGSFFVGIFGVQTPDSTFIRVISVIPPFSVMTMPSRWAAGDATWWELTLSIALMVVAIVGLVRLAGRVYAGAVLRSGPRVKMREALAAGRAPVAL